MKMRMLMCLLAAAISSGCVGATSRTIVMENYPARHAMFDVTFGWKKVDTANSVTLDGYVRNNRYFQIADLIVTVVLLDAQGKEKAREDFVFVPSRIPMDTAAPFNVTLKNAARSGDTFKFVYHYDGLQGREDATKWLNSFDAPAAQ